ncbi:MAG: hypothetical protein LBM93_01820 [Oscillospiraceae bacterium]|jgi:hypothetical protein|nr:hypothetical protein [Oscillospiraceae bacterium]
MKKNILATIILLTVILTGCSDNKTSNNNSEGTFSTLPTSPTPTSETATTTATSDNTSEIDSTDTTDTMDEIFLDSVTAGVRNPKSTYTYQGSPLNLEYQYSAVGAKSVGFVILCDGFSVPYSTNLSTEEKSMHIIPHEGDGVKIDVDFKFTPIGKKGDKISIEVVDIVAPDYDISQLDLNTEDGSGIYPIIFGKRFFHAYTTIIVDMQADGAENNNTISNKYTKTEIPPTDIESFLSENDDGTFTNQLDFLQASGTITAPDGTKNNLAQIVNQGDKIKLEFQYCGTNGLGTDKIITSFYLNNEIYPIFEGKNYAECEIDKQNYSLVTGELDTSNLEKGRYICYALSGNDTTNLMTNCLPTFVIEVE